MALFKKKEEQEKKDTGVPVPVQLRRKFTVTVISLVLLLVLAAAGTVGWYTRMNNVSGITLNIAKYDFRANYSDDTFMVDVNDYREVHVDKAAPGTSGVIPVLLTNNSETATKYYLYMDLTGMAPEMLQRVRFYVYRNDGYGKPVLEGDGKTPKKYYLGGIRTLYANDTGNYGGTAQKDDVYETYLTNDTGVAYDLKSCGGLTSDHSWNYLNHFVVSDTMDAENNTRYEYVYWEWIYDLDVDPSTASSAEGCVFYDVRTGRWESWARYNDLRGNGENRAKLSEAHDAFDTALGNGVYDNFFSSTIDGKNFQNVTKTGKLLAYQAALMPKICVDGVQATPLGKVGQTYYDLTVLKAGGGLTVYVNEDELAS